MSRTYGLGPAPQCLVSGKKRLFGETHHVRHVNETIFANSNIVAGRSFAGLWRGRCQRPAMVAS
jgi:hypothetical protein